MMDDVIERKISADPNEQEIKKIIEESASFNQVIAVTYNTSSFKKQAELVRQLVAERNDRLVVVAVRNPFDFLDFREVQAQIACYESRPLVLQSTAKVLIGEIQAKGKLPVHF